MTSTSPPSGWYPDPNQPGLLRWWDGRAWTEHTQSTTAAAAPGGEATGGPSQRVGDFTIPADLPSPPPRGGRGWGRPTRRGYPSGGNRLSITVFCIEAVYVVLSATTGFFLIGILPLFLSIRAISAKEKLGPVALAVTIVGFVVSIGLSAHHHG